MKVMAIGTLKPLSPEQHQRYMPKEVPATLQLYLDGKMEQFWLRDKQEGVTFLIEARQAGRFGELCCIASPSPTADHIRDLGWQGVIENTVFDPPSKARAARGIVPRIEF